MDFQSIKTIKLYKKLLRNISDGVIIFKNSGSVLWCNQIAAQMLGKSRQYLIGSDIKNSLPRIKNNKKAAIRFTVKLEGKLPKIFEVKEVILEKKSPKINAIFLKDITLLKEQEKELKAIKKKSNHYKTITPAPKEAKYNFNHIIGQNCQLLSIKRLAQRAAPTSYPILIFGETGTGKELYAQSIHNASKRSDNPFIAINCAAIPENLIEGIFFGTVKGAYTGAVDRPGLFEQASEGTLFLDEINSMPLCLQAKLLRVIQEGRLRKVGGKKDIAVNPRIISSTNVEPFKAIEKNLLRSDLFYRLGVVYLTIPPLRDRKDDLPILTSFFIKRICKSLNIVDKNLSPEVMEVFRKYDWPGNVRQLQHALECALTFIEVDETDISLEYLPGYLKVTSTESQTPVHNKSKAISLQDEINKTEKNKIIMALEESNGNISNAAQILQISRQCLYYRMKKFNINISKSRII